MKNRLLTRIREVRLKRQKLFCAFLTLGYPSISAVKGMILEFEKLGVDILELGFPYSDPLADGPTIQFSSEAALRRKVTLEDAFRTVEMLRRMGLRMPVIFFSYLNPIYHYGMKAFVKRAKRAGFDGLIIPDLLPGSEPVLEAACRESGLCRTFLAAPTTPKARAVQLARKSKGFVYFVSTRGVTGARKAVPADIRASIRAMNRACPTPVLIGFGVSSPEQAKIFAAMSQGVIVGSAIIDRIRKAGGRTASAVRFVDEMVRAVKEKQ
ncbi:MAG: tryptophan synthase subunit alpha [Candidatus Omnitrophota bacterium]